MRNILDFDLKKLEAVFLEWHEPAYHARQVFNWVFKKGVLDFLAMSDLPAALRLRLKDNFYLFDLKLIKRLVSRDGTEKFLFSLKDGNLIEAVTIPTEKRVTACISTQAGCKFNCFFCASGVGGFKRNLTDSEILQEALYLKSNSALGKITHIVFMGTGEPLDNYENLLSAIRRINSQDCLGIGARRITISTCGLVPGIQRLAEEGLQIELSVSLHAADDKTRSRLMPINKKYPLRELIATCAKYIAETNRQVTFEYILASGVNSDLQNAQRLSTILEGLNCKVNLIPANPVSASCLKPPGKLEVLLFKDYLIKHGMNVTLRRERGQDIEAACGQLRAKYEEK